MTKTKTASKPLLTEKEISTAKLETLEADRTSTNNRISGLKTQLKRAGTDKAKAAKAQARLDEMIKHRELVGKEIAAKRTPADVLAERVADAGKPETTKARGRRDRAVTGA